MTYRSLTLCLLFFLPTCSLAIDLDKQEALLIEANYGEVNERAGATTYSGEVSVIQGSLKILADEVQVKTNKNGDVIEVIATSNQGFTKPARIEKISGGTGKVEATAQQIKYLVEKQQVKLSGNALVQKNKDEFMGELVYYDIEEGIVKIDGGEENAGRVRIKYGTTK